MNTIQELTHTLKEQFPEGVTDHDLRNLKEWVVEEDAEPGKVYEAIINNYAPKVRHFPPLKNIKMWFGAGHYEDRRPTDNLFSEIMDIGQAMTLNQIYYKVCSIRKEGNWHLREEIFVALFSDIYVTWAMLKEKSSHENQIEVYLNKADAKGKILRGEAVRIPTSMFDDIAVKPEYREEELKSVEELL